MKIILIKTIFWRVIASIITIVIALIFTGRLEISLWIALIDAAGKTLFYYYHEKLWEWYNGRRS